MEILTYDSEFTLVVLAISSLYFLFVASPLLMASFEILRKRREIKRPWLFLGTVAVIAYGLFSTILLLLLVPLMFYDAFVAPQLIAAKFYYPEFLLSLGNAVEKYGWIILPLLLVVLSLVSTVKISKRWAVICNAISS